MSWGGVISVFLGVLAFLFGAILMISGKPVFEAEDPDARDEGFFCLLVGTALLLLGAKIW
jgi:hypothetical protein